MDETDPVARAQQQLRDDLELVQRYGRDEAADHCGGCYWDNEPPVIIVALFTAEVDRHRSVLRSRVTQPTRLAVRATPWTWRQVQADNEEIAAMLLTARTEPGVHGVGTGLREGRFMVCVHIEPYTAEGAARSPSWCSRARSLCSKVGHTTPYDPRARARRAAHTALSSGISGAATWVTRTSDASLHRGRPVLRRSPLRAVTHRAALA
jgi:hypothetical protein